MYCWYLPQCRRCDDLPCELAAQPSWSGEEAQTQPYDAYVPGWEGCVYIHRLPRGSAQVVVKWGFDWDWLVLAKIGAGLTLLWYWEGLKQSSLLHATIGIVGSLVIIATGVAWYLFQELRGARFGVVSVGFVVMMLSTMLTST